jgi:thiosulfate/3-mercaptopyruvate sulfurtransferase
MEQHANSHLLVSPEWLEAHLDDPQVRIVDIRPAEAYQRGHIPNAVHLELARIGINVDGVPDMLIPQTEMEAILGGLDIDPETTVVAYDNVWGMVAARLFWALEHYGHRDARILDGVWDRWTAEGRKVTQEVVEVSPRRYLARPEPGRLATLEWIRDNLQRPDLVLLDARSPGEYAAGCLPGAVNVDWMEAVAFGGQHMLKPATELRRLFAQVGVVEEREVVAYCHSGARSSHTYFVLRLLGFPRVRNYDGSWVEWQRKIVRREA